MMATPPQTIATSRWRSFASLVMFQYGPIFLSMIAGITVSVAFYVVFGRLTAIITGVLYIIGLFAAFTCKDVVKVVCYPRYDTLSERRKDEVDKVRVRGLKRILEAVTLTIEKEHLIQKGFVNSNKSPSSVTTTTVDSSSSYMEHLTSSSDSDQDDDDVDLESGQHSTLTATFHSARSSINESFTSASVGGEQDNIAIDLDLHNSEEKCPETEYTHVRLPCPGMMQCQVSNKEVTELPTREVTSSCPICLCAYEEGQSVCYSTNPECPHAFHSDCILTWFVQVGRLHNDDIIIGHMEKLTERRLLDYSLDCPCCRQPFIQKEHVSDDIKEKKMIDAA